MKAKFMKSVETLKVITLLLFAMFLTACTTNSTVRNVPPVANTPVQRPVPRPLPPQDRVIVSSVVRDLMKKAQNQRQSGDFDGAANSLERALRIEPRNAQIWSRLAGVRYSQESWKKAIQLAAKSNTLAGQNKTLRRENWYLMSNAHKALGNVDAEQKYRNKLNRQARPVRR